MSRNPSNNADVSGAIPMDPDATQNMPPWESGADSGIASNALEQQILDRGEATDRAYAKDSQGPSVEEVPNLSLSEEQEIDAFFDELAHGEMHDKWLEDGEKLNKAFEKVSKRTLDQFEQHLERRQKMMEDIAKKREAAEAKKVVDAYKEDMRAALRNLGVSRDHVLASMVEAHLGGVSAENIPQRSTSPEASTPLPERTAFEAPKEAGLVQTLEARLDHLSSEADKYPRFSPEREEAMKEMKQIRRELQTIERERNSAKNLKGRLDKARATAKELGTEEAQGLKTELETAKTALAEAESGLSAKEEVLAAAEQALADARAKHEAAKSAPKPKDKEPRGFDEDPEYNQILNDLALEYLKTEDKDWFDRNFNGERDDKGRLLDADGNPTPFLPINNITGALKTIQEKAQAAFEAAQPEKAANYKTWAGEKPGALKKKVTEAHKAMLGARDALKDHQKNLEALRTDAEKKAEAYQATAPELDAAQERLEKLEGEAKAARERKGSDEDAIVQVGKRERKRQELETPEIIAANKEEAIAQTKAERTKKQMEDFDDKAQANVLKRLSNESFKSQHGAFREQRKKDPHNAILERMVRLFDAEETRREGLPLKERRQEQKNTRDLNTFKLDYAFHIGQLEAAKKMGQSSDFQEAQLGQIAFRDLSIKHADMLQKAKDLGMDDISLAAIKPRPLSNAERRRWKEKYHAEGEEVETVPADREAQEIAQREFAEGIAKAEKEAEKAQQAKLKALRKNSTKRLETRLEKLHAKISEALVPSNEDVETADLIEAVLVERGSKGPDVPDEEIKRVVALSKPLTPEERDALARELQSLSLEAFTERSKEDLAFFDTDPGNVGFRSRAEIYTKELQRRSETEDTKGNLSSKMKRRVEGVAHVREQVSDESSVVEAIDVKHEDTSSDAPAVSDAAPASETVYQSESVSKAPKKKGRRTVEVTDLPSKDETAHMTEDGSVEYKDPETRAKEEAEAALKKTEADLAAEVEAHRVKAEARRAKEAEEEAAKAEEDPGAVTESEPGAREAAEALFGNLNSTTSEATEASGKSDTEAKADAEALFSGLDKKTSAEVAEPEPSTEARTSTPDTSPEEKVTTEPPKETSANILKSAEDLTIRGLVDLIQETQKKSLEIRKTQADPEGMALVADLQKLLQERISSPEKVRAEIDKETDPEALALLQGLLAKSKRTGGGAAAA